MFLGRWEIDDLLTFSVITGDVAPNGIADADNAPVYRVYEDETGAAILTGSMTKLDDDNTVGFYSEQITLSAANGFEVGKCYRVYIAYTLTGVARAQQQTWQVEAAQATASAIATAQAAITDIQTDVDELQTTAASLATSSALSTAQTGITAIKAKTDNLPADPASQSGVLNGVPAKVWDEALSGHLGGGTTGAALDGAGGGGPTAADIADAIWDEAQGDHGAAGSTGELADDYALPPSNADNAEAAWAMVIEEGDNGPVTPAGVLRTLLAYFAGIVTGGGTNEIRYQSQDGLRDRIVQNGVDVDGNRASVDLDLSE